MVSTSVTYTAFAGYIIAGKNPDPKLFAVLLGIFILSSGASAFNHIQERGTDARMARTSNRPLPSGRLSLKFTIWFALLATFLGSFILILTSGWIVGLLGLFNLLWYNLVYTPLKKVTVWAVFVGTITGVVPFYMGFLSGLNQVPGVEANFIAFFLFIWQIPHFMLLLGIYGHEYEMAGLASITAKTNEMNLFRMASLWLMACCVLALSFPLFNLLNYQTTAYVITTISGMVFVISIFSVFKKDENKFKRLFLISNIMQTAIMTCFVLDRVL